MAPRKAADADELRRSVVLGRGSRLIRRHPAVGDVSPADAPSHAIIDHWNGRRWQLVPGPPTRSELYGVAALSAHDV